MHNKYIHFIHSLLQWHSTFTITLHIFYCIYFTHSGHSQNNLYIMICAIASSLWHSQQEHIIFYYMHYCKPFTTFTTIFHTSLHSLLHWCHDLHNNSYFITFTTAMYLQYSKQQFIFYCIHYCNSFTTFTTLAYTLLYSLLLKSLQEYYYFNNCEDVVESQFQSSPAIGHALLSSLMHCLLLRVISSFARPNWKHTVIHISKTRGVRSRGSPLVSCIYIYM